MQSSSGRAQRIEAQMQRALAELLSRSVKDPRVAGVTITAVSLSPDMGTAKIHFLPFSARHSAEAVGAGLASASGFLRGAVGRQLGLRHAPRLEFIFDTALEQAQNLTQLIDRAVKEDHARADAGADDDPVGPASVDER
jgi:ribosome-binding factor A